MYGKPELVDDYVSVGGHAYRPDLRIAIFKWINKHVKGDTTTVVKDVDAAVFAGRMLRVFRTDDDVPKDAVNANIDETFVPRAKTALPPDGTFPQWKRSLLADLRMKVFRTFPKKIPPGKFLEINIASPVTTEPGIIALLGFMESSEAQIRSRLGVLCLAVAEDDRRGRKGYKDLEPFLAKRYPCALYARGHGPADGLNSQLNWTSKSPPNYLERSHALLGRTPDEGRVWDIAATVNLLLSYKDLDDVKKPERDWSVIGRGQAGILTAYAALFEPSIKEVVIIDPPKSHKEGPCFLNVLRVLDIPEALGLLAPDVKLTLINARDPAFDWTAALYRLAGAAEKFVRK